METVLDLPDSALKICKPIAVADADADSLTVKSVISEIAKLLQQYYDVQVVF